MKVWNHRAIRLAAIGILALSASQLSAEQNSAEKNSADKAIEIGSRLELFVDRLLVDKMENVEFRLHQPQPMPIAKNPIVGAHMTVVKDSDKNGVLYRAWYRTKDPEYTLKGRRHGGSGTGGPQDLYGYAESRDGHEWTKPKLNIFKVSRGEGANNAVLRVDLFSHNFAPFLDNRADLSAAFFAVDLAKDPGRTGSFAISTSLAEITAPSRLSKSPTRKRSICPC